MVNGNSLVACFENSLTDEEIKEIAGLHPLYAVFRESCFGSDSAELNLKEIFKAVSPETQEKDIMVI